MGQARFEVLRDLFIVPGNDRAAASVSFTAPDGCAGVSWEVSEDDGIVAGGSESAGGGEAVRFDVAMGDFKPWNVDTPHLYTLKLALDVDGETTDVTEMFGMRTIGTDGGNVVVNGKPTLIRGHIRGREAHDHPNLAGLAEEEFYAKNIRAAKACGFNLMRFHSKVPPEECFAAADRLGMFIHVEYRTYFGLYQEERDLLNDAGELIDLDGWREMILRLRNHPSLMVYCIGNEIRHPGTNPRVAEIAAATRELDDTRLFIDTCAHGEFDRTYVDIDVQHMSYFYPLAENAGMFENTQNWLIFGSCTGLPMVEPRADEDAPARVMRAIHPMRPVMAHEVCHYVGLRDLDALGAKFDAAGAERPWWIAELKKLVALKGLEEDYPRMLAASRHFQRVGWKLGVEAARRSRLLGGFHFLQLADTDRYENANGILDCFDDPKDDETAAAFQRFNGDSAILADLPRRTFFEGEDVEIPVMLSHFSPSIEGLADFAFRLTGDGVDVAGGLAGIDLDARGLREMCRVKLTIPQLTAPAAMTLTMKLSADGETLIENAWDLWAWPNRPEEVESPRCTVDLDEIDLTQRYPQLQSAGSLDEPTGLMIVNRFSEGMLNHLATGGDVLMLYRVPETRDRQAPAEKETHYLPATWDRFKGVIWDRGTNLGAFMRDSAALSGFPHTGVLDLQFHGLVDDCDKICLDDFPVAVQPIIQGVDKASRDRFDVHTFKLRELQPEWTMRKFAHLFELRVGPGRLLVTGLNFTGVSTDVPEACGMFESLLRHVTSDAFRPAAELSPDALRDYLLAKGAAPRIRERMMTQYWQLNDAPLESAQYWKDAEAYIRRG